MKNSALILTGILFFLFSSPSYAQLPEGFGIEPVIESVDEVAGIRFLNDSISFIWSLDGKIFSTVNFAEPETPILDISDEVGRWGDHAMLGFAIHPQFAQNGLIYMLYPVDQYNLLNADDPDYDPNISDNYKPSLARLTRYELETDYPFGVVEGSRTVLIGSEIDNGIPQMSASHGAGSLAFGSDGTLLVSCGEGSTWVGAFNGGPPYPDFAYDEEGMALGILSEDQNLGSFRAQYIDSYNGKILRIDPISGDGLESNPFYEAEHPESPRSKVWSLGLRNPFRFIVRPSTGSSIPSAGDPGTLFIGDVGYYRWEEINVADGPALNFGWPIYEGMTASIDYADRDTYHPYYENPISCSITNYRFQDLLVPPNAAHSYIWPNPCDALIDLEDSISKFAHERPTVAYSNEATPHDYDVLLPSFDDIGLASSSPTDLLESFSEGGFTGISSIGGDFYYGSSYPEEYFGTYFQSDYSGWLKAFWFDENNQLTDFQHISSELGPVISTRFNPYDECMYFTSGFPSTVFKLCYGGNVKPNAVVMADTIYGASPLTVFLDGSLSSDADEDPLTFAWDLGDGATSSASSLSHVFSAPDSNPLSYEVSLLVTDTAGNSDVESIIIALNNTPPIVTISSLADSSLYSTSNTTLVPLMASVTDIESGDTDLIYEWQTTQHHNSHTHTNPYDNAHETSTVFEPTGCEVFATYYYTVSLRVTDPGGLSGYNKVTVLPDCDGVIPPPVSFDEITTYPNPSNGNLTIRGPLVPEELFDISLIDDMGRIIYRQSHQVDQFSRIGLELNKPSPGQYFLRMTGHSETTTLPIFIFSPQ